MDTTDPFPASPATSDAFGSAPATIAAGPAKELAPDHAVVLLNYLLLALSPLTLFISGLIAVVVGLIRKGGSDEVARAHFRFQRTTYWIVLLITIAAVAAALAGFLTGMINLPWGHSYRLPDGSAPPPARGDETLVIVGFAGLALSLLVLLGAWLFGLIRILFGVVRIAMNQPIGSASH